MIIKSQLIPFLPIFALCLIVILTKSKNLSLYLSGQISLAFSILFLVSCFSLKALANPISFNLLSIGDNLNFAWILDRDNWLFLFFIGWFWLVVEFYSKSYFVKSGDSKINQFRPLFLGIITILTFLVLSQNMLSAMLCYQLLILILCFISLQFAPQINQKSAKNFSSFILFSSVFLPIATALIFKIAGNVDFVYGGIIVADKINLWQYSLLFCLCSISLALIAFVPIYLLFNNLHHFTLPIIITILASFAFSSLFLLFKIIFYIFGNKLFINFNKIIDYHHLITIIICLNLLACGLLAIFSKNLKQILIFLFFNQMIFVIIEFFNFGLNARQMQIAIITFVLSQLTIFLVIGNINLYLKASADKTLNGIFYKLRFTILMLILILFSIAGLLPGSGMLDKYWLLKSVIASGSWIGAMILLINLLLVLICIIKIIYPMIEIFGKNNNQKSYEISSAIAKDIELDLNLILPIFLTILLIVMMLFIR